MLEDKLHEYEEKEQRQGFQTPNPRGLEGFTNSGCSFSDEGEIRNWNSVQTKPRIIEGGVIPDLYLNPDESR